MGLAPAVWHDKRGLDVVMMIRNLVSRAAVERQCIRKFICAASEVSKHVSEGHPYVCGVISGETNPGRKIGVRFITAEPYHLVIGFKYSRRPIAYSGNDQFTIDEYHRQIETFNKLNSEICK